MALKKHPLAGRSISGWDVLGLPREQTKGGMCAATWSDGSGDLMLSLVVGRKPMSLLSY